MITPDLSKLPDYQYPDIAERFYREVRDHEMKILHDQGLYRHLKCKSPKDSSYWFEIITVPNSLTFRGDGESFVFHRTQDMFSFFRSGFYHGQIHINPSYWAEKVTSSRENLKIYREDHFEKVVWEYFEESKESGSVEEEHEEALRAALIHMLETEDYNCSDAAYRTLDNFEFYYDPKDASGFQVYGNGRPDFKFEDVWDWFNGRLHDYDWWFLWAQYAIVWAIRHYDVAKGTAGPVDITDTLKDVGT